jgi:cytochrome c oxidase subunit 2
MKLRSVLLSALLATTLAASLISIRPINAQSAPRRIEVAAKRFSFTPGDLTLKKGEPVVIILKSEDVSHGVRVKDLGLDMKVGKGQTSEFTFTPNKVGDFVAKCSVFCGSGHGSMRLTMHVVE